MKRFDTLAMLVLCLIYSVVNVDARYFDPVEGRFLSEDPAGFVDGPNKYTYVQNNPVNLTDPTGLMSQCTSGLDALGGYSIGPLYHQYHCWTGADGNQVCRGYGRDPGSGALEAIKGPVGGIILKDDKNGNGKCGADDNNKCMDRCVSNKWNNLEIATPAYGWIKGTECKVVAQKVYVDCQKLCSTVK